MSKVAQYQIMRIAAMYASGFSITEVATALNLSSSTIVLVLTALGVK